MVIGVIAVAEKQMLSIRRCVFSAGYAVHPIVVGHKRAIYVIYNMWCRRVLFKNRSSKQFDKVRLNNGTGQVHFWFISLPAGNLTAYVHADFDGSRDKVTLTVCPTPDLKSILPSSK